MAQPGSTSQAADAGWGSKAIPLVHDSRVPLAFGQSLGGRSELFGTGLRLSRHLPLRHVSALTVTCRGSNSSKTGVLFPLSKEDRASMTMMTRSVQEGHDP